jgi:hypothetical protein
VQRWSSITLLAGAISLAVSIGEAVEKNPDPCALLTKSEIESVQGERVIATKASQPERGRFAVSQCFYSLPTFSKSISLEVTRPRANEREKPEDQWKAMFREAPAKKGEREREGRGEKEEREKESSPPRKIAGIGDEAYWVGPAIVGGLYVRKGDSYFRLSVGGADREAVKIEKLKKLGRNAVRRLSRSPELRS